jgi:hypothetical protein
MVWGSPQDPPTTGNTHSTQLTEQKAEAETITASKTMPAWCENPVE